MSRKKQTKRSKQNQRRKPNRQSRRKNKTIFNEVCRWIVPKGELFTKDTFHGNMVLAK